jgi:hypothetical protein
MSRTVATIKSPSPKKSRADYWVCLPKPGHTLHGVSRVKLFGLIFPNEANGFQPPVQSALIRRGNARRATLMVNEGSLLNYIRATAADQSPSNNNRFRCTTINPCPTATVGTNSV